MSGTEGAPITKRCPRCTETKDRLEYSPSAFAKPGGRCRVCRSESNNRPKAEPRFRILSAAELEYIRKTIACLVCGAVPKAVRGGRVTTNHAIDCTAADRRLRKTG